MCYSFTIVTDETFDKQECIPVGCVPSAAVAVSAQSRQPPPGADTHPEQTPPPKQTHPRSRHCRRSRHPREQTPPGADSPPGSRHPPPPLWTDTRL